jgi:hypothetical protein
MLYMDSFGGWESGLSFGERGLDILFAIFYLIYFQLPAVKNRFQKVGRP